MQRIRLNFFSQKSGHKHSCPTATIVELSLNVIGDFVFPFMERINVKTTFTGISTYELRINLDHLTKVKVTLCNHELSIVIIIVIIVIIIVNGLPS